MVKSFFGNSCVSGWVYYHQQLQYNNPFIWHLILNDKGFLKMVKNFNHYINQEPVFIEQDVNDGRYKHTSIDTDYPIMKLDDVNLHFIHHKDSQVVYDNYMKRIDRIQDTEIITVCWDNEIKDLSVRQELQNMDNVIMVSAKNQDDAAKKIITKLW